MSEIPNVGEFFRDCMEGGQSVYNRNQLKFLKRAVEFAKLHVKAALEAAAENAQAKENPADYGTGEIWVDKKSILSAYPESNIQ